MVTGVVGVAGVAAQPHATQEDEQGREDASTPTQAAQELRVLEAHPKYPNVTQEKTKNVSLPPLLTLSLCYQIFSGDRMGYKPSAVMGN